jgi:hypothetical protein
MASAHVNKSSAQQDSWRLQDIADLTQTYDDQVANHFTSVWFPDNKPSLVQIIGQAPCLVKTSKMNPLWSADHSLPFFANDFDPLHNDARPTVKVTTTVDGADRPHRSVVRLLQLGLAINEQDASNSEDTASHDCDHKWCAQRHHLHRETALVNKARDACHRLRWANKVCQHQPPCRMY